MCLVNIAGSAPADNYGEILADIETMLNADNRAVQDEELEHVKRDTEWHYYEAIAPMTKQKKCDLEFSTGDSLLLNLDNKNGADKWVTGYKKMYGFYWVKGDVPTNFVKATSKSLQIEEEPKVTFGSDKDC